MRDLAIEMLLGLQNHKVFCNQDIMTITGFMKTAQEVYDHYARCLETIKNAA